MNEIIPGVLHWKAEHPNLHMDVSSYLLTASGLALDPILPPDEGPDWLGHPVRKVVLTIRHHLRNAADFGVPIFVHEDGMHEFEGYDEAEVQAYSAGDELADGVRALSFGRISPDDTALKLEIGPGALAFGDGLIRYGELGYPPDQLLGDDPAAVKSDIVDGLVPLLEEDFDALLFAHGDPVPSGGKEMLQRFLDSRR